MKPNNLEALKTLLTEVLDCFAREGSVETAKGNLLPVQTHDARREFSALQRELQLADSAEHVGEIAMRARMRSVRLNCYIPREYVLLYERLCMLKTLYDEGMIDNPDWWRANSLKLKKKP